MEYEQFKSEVADKILDHLPDKYADASVMIQEVAKNNVVLDGLVIRDESINITPTVYLNSYFEDIQNGNITVDEALNNIATVYSEHALTTNYDIANLTEYPNVEDKIFPRIVGIENNEALLSNRPHEIVAEDLAVTYYIAIANDADGTMSAPITNSLMEHFGVDQQELHDTAMDNMANSMDFEFRSMGDMLMEMMVQDLGSEEAAREFMETAMPEEGLMYVLSNVARHDGAIGILDEKTMESIGEKIGSDFYVLPSSIHECIVVPMGENAPPRSELENMVKEVNATQVAPQDRLSDSVYAYDRETKELIRADKYEEKQISKAMEKEKESIADKPKSFKEALSEAKKESASRMEDRKSISAPKKKREASL